MYRTPFQNVDSYKLSHWLQYPDSVGKVYSNFTPRKSIDGKRDRFVFFGLQAFLRKLTCAFADNFFALPEEAAVEDYVQFYWAFFGSEPCDSLKSKVRELHQLGYLPITVKALREGSIVRHGVPVLTVINTDDRFGWVTNFIESWMSAELWGPCTSATTAWMYRREFDRYAAETSDQDFMPAFQGHDFSFRGMWGIEAASMSGAAHLLSFGGTDTCPALNWIEKYYPGDNGFIGTSVPATEHSVMCAGGQDDEEGTFRRLMKIHPSGILSVVSDTWDFWHVVTNILPKLKDEIMQRDGKLVIRPDSSPKTPVEIICGDPDAPEGSPEWKGLIRCLHEAFGAERNSKGYLQLDPHIGAIYGDSITLEYQQRILQGLKDLGYSSTNIVLGIGSYTYTYVTRDTHGLAMKATAVVTRDGTVVPIFKDPKTDRGGKKSHRGMLAVVEQDGEYGVVQDASFPVTGDMLEMVYSCGVFERIQTFADVRHTLRRHSEALQ